MLELILWLSTLFFQSPHKAYDQALIILRFVRAVIIAILAVCVVLALRKNLGSGLDDRPLIDGSTCEYGSIHSTPLVQPARSTLDEAPSERGQKSAWTHTKEYVSLVWPSGNPRIQLWLLVKVLHIARDRGMKPVQLLILRSIFDDPTSSDAYLRWAMLCLVFLVGNIDFLNGRATNRIESFIEDRLADLGHIRVMEQTAEYRATNDSDELAKAIEQASESVPSLCDAVFITVPMAADFVIGAFLLAYLSDAWIFLNVMFLAATYAQVTFIATTWLSGPRRLAAELERTASRILHTSLRLWKTASIFQLEAHEQRRYTKARAQHLRQRRRYHDRFYIIQDVYKLIDVTTALTALFLVMEGVRDGKISPGTIPAVYYAWKAMTRPLSNIADMWPHLSSHLARAERLLAIITTKPPVCVDVEPTLPLTHGDIVFEDVSFGYKDQCETIKGISFTVKKGQTMAIIGRKGAGKSTLIDLILRLREPTGGCITIDGFNISEYSVSSLRRHLSVVPQFTEMFDLSILDNVKLGKLDASEEEVRRALQQAEMDEEILNRPGGSVGLSGGEAQGISLARAILKGGQVLILDEATSAVDTKTEAMIQRSLQKLKSGRTTLVVAHRLSTVKSADEILVLDKGQIIEQGTHAQLLELKGAYYELWESPEIVDGPS